ANETRALGARARSATLQAREIEGATFTVSNLGMHGVVCFDAIVTPPQVAVLAVGAAVPRMLVHDGRTAIAHIMSLTLTADHRLIDGAVGAAFLATLRHLIEMRTN